MKTRTDFHENRKIHHRIHNILQLDLRWARIIQLTYSYHIPFRFLSTLSSNLTYVPNGIFSKILYEFLISPRFGTYASYWSYVEEAKPSYKLFKPVETHNNQKGGRLECKSHVYHLRRILSWCLPQNCVKRNGSFDLSNRQSVDATSVIALLWLATFSVCNPARERPLLTFIPLR